MQARNINTGIYKAVYCQSFLFFFCNSCLHLISFYQCILDAGAGMAQGSSKGFLLFQQKSPRAISSDASRAIAWGKDLKRVH